jgi:hypothetical protein
MDATNQLTTECYHNDPRTVTLKPFQASDGTRQYECNHCHQTIRKSVCEDTYFNNAYDNLKSVRRLIKELEDGTNYYLEGSDAQSYIDTANDVYIQLSLQGVTEAVLPEWKKENP